MTESLASQCCLIVLFWILVPTFDQYTDMNLIQRLFRGPSNDTNISSCKFITKVHEILLESIVNHNKSFVFID